MKKNFIYALIACFTLSLAACSTDPEDATSKHVYGENENPYLKTNADAVVSTKAVIISLLLISTLFCQCHSVCCTTFPLGL